MAALYFFFNSINSLISRKEKYLIGKNSNRE